MPHSLTSNCACDTPTMDSIMTQSLIGKNELYRHLISHHWGVITLWWYLSWSNTFLQPGRQLFGSLHFYRPYKIFKTAQPQTSWSLYWFVGAVAEIFQKTTSILLDKIRLFYNDVLKDKWRAVPKLVLRSSQWQKQGLIVHVDMTATSKNDKTFPLTITSVYDSSSGYSLR